MENMGYAVAAYAAVWLGLAAYVAWLGARQAAVERDIRALREALSEEHEGAANPTSEAG